MSDVFTLSRHDVLSVKHNRTKKKVFGKFRMSQWVCAKCLPYFRMVSISWSKVKLKCSWKNNHRTGTCADLSGSKDHVTKRSFQRFPRMFTKSILIVKKSISSKDSAFLLNFQCNRYVQNVEFYARPFCLQFFSS